MNTAAEGPNEALRKSTPIVFDANGNVVYDKNGNPLPMYFNYGGKNYQSVVVMPFTKISTTTVTSTNSISFTWYFKPEDQWWFRY